MVYSAILNIGCVMNVEELKCISEEIKTDAKNNCDIIDVANKYLKTKNLPYKIYTTYGANHEENYCYLVYTEINDSENSNNINAYKKKYYDDILKMHLEIKNQFEEVLLLLFGDNNKYKLEIFATFNDY